MAQLVAHSTVSRCIVGSSPCWAKHFSFPQVLRDGVIKSLGMYSRLCDWAYKRSCEREGDCLPVVGFVLVSFIK